MAVSQMGSYCECNILKLIVPLAQMNESACSGIISFELLYALAHEFLVNVATGILNDCLTSVTTVTVK